jgi:hypothetical protein
VALPLRLLDFSIRFPREAPMAPDLVEIVGLTRAVR